MRLPGQSDLAVGSLIFLHIFGTERLSVAVVCEAYSHSTLLILICGSGVPTEVMYTVKKALAFTSSNATAIKRILNFQQSEEAVF